MMNNLISIITVAFNRPEFIEWQYKLLKKYLKGKFIYSVYNNSPNAQIGNEIHQSCKQLQLDCFNVPQNLCPTDGASLRAGTSLDYAIKHNVEHYNNRYMLILDSDLFLVNHLNPLDRLKGNHLLGMTQQKQTLFYYSNQLILADILNLPNFINEKKFPPGTINDEACDCGAFLFNYIKKNKIKHVGLNKKGSGSIKEKDLAKIAPPL